MNYFSTNVLLNAVHYSTVTVLLFMVLLSVLICDSQNPSTLRNKAHKFVQLQSQHELGLLSTSQMTTVARRSNTSHISYILDHILIPRVVGTSNHSRVFNFLRDQLLSMSLDVEVDQFESDTPFGKKTFRNIIARHHPNADRYLVLACHYDSKYFRNSYFVGATDSAVPCAMMLNLAHLLSPELEQHRYQPTVDVSLVLLFLDGEEAFVKWNAADSIYGARHLVARWLSPNAIYQTQSTGELIANLHRIDLFLLLDLLGAAQPSFYNHFGATEHWFNRLAEIEAILHRLKLLQNHQRHYFRLSEPNYYSGIEDDHIPFYKNGVPILHLIATPFPTQWHTKDDNRYIIHKPTVENLNRILRVFVCEYLHMNPREQHTIQTNYDETNEQDHQPEL